MNQTGSFEEWRQVGLALFLLLGLVAPRLGWVWRWMHTGPALLNLGRYQKARESAAKGVFLFVLYMYYFPRYDKDAGAVLWGWIYFLAFVVAAAVVYMFEYYLPLLVTENGFLFRNHLITWDQIKAYRLVGDHFCILEIKKLPQYRFSNIEVDLPPGRKVSLLEILSSHVTIAAEVSR
jgi:hypothetical protein